MHIAFLMMFEVFATEPRNRGEGEGQGWRTSGQNRWQVSGGGGVLFPEVARTAFSPNNTSDNVSVVHGIRLGRTRVHVGAPAVVPPPEFLVKSCFVSQV
jgi:hypothetical protein